MLTKNILITLLTLTLPCKACNLMPKNTFGVCFNNSPTLNTTIIKHYGSLNYNYLIDTTTLPGRTSYLYRCHYDTNTLAHITITTHPTDSTDYGFTNMLHFSPPPNSPNPQLYILTELNWLSNSHITNLTPAQNKLIANAFTHNNYYYWTKQDTLLDNSTLITRNNTILTADCSPNPPNTPTPPPHTLTLPTTTTLPTHHHKTPHPLLPASLINLQGRTTHPNSHYYITRNPYTNKTRTHLSP